MKVQQSENSLIAAYKEKDANGNPIAVPFPTDFQAGTFAFTAPIAGGVYGDSESDFSDSLSEKTTSVENDMKLTFTGNSVHNNVSAKITGDKTTYIYVVGQAQTFDNLRFTVSSSEYDINNDSSILTVNANTAVQLVWVANPITGYLVETATPVPVGDIESGAFNAALGAKGAQIKGDYAAVTSGTTISRENWKRYALAGISTTRQNFKR